MSTSSTSVAQQRTSSSSSSNDNEVLNDIDDHHDMAEEEGTEKYNKRKRIWKRRLNTASGALSSSTFTLLFSVVIFCSLGYVALNSRRRASYEEAWDRIERAKMLLNKRRHGEENDEDDRAARRHHLRRKWDDVSPLHREPRRREEGGGNGGAMLESLTDRELLDLFESSRPKDTSRRLQRSHKDVLYPTLREWAHRLDETAKSNKAGGLRWIRPYLLPPISHDEDDAALDQELVATPDHKHNDEPNALFRAFRGHKSREKFVWRKEWEEMQQGQQNQMIRFAKKSLEPPVDYTQQKWYEYPRLQSSPPEEGGYPKMSTLSQLLRDWPQTEDISESHKIKEVLLHFNFSDPEERAMAERFRDARLPFKVYDIPEISYVSKLWTDDYVHKQFNGENGFSDLWGGSYKKADGLCQESPDHFFAFFVPPMWQTATMGLPPVRNNDMTYKEWADHARYADAKPLASDQPHYYWQAGAPANERFAPLHKQSFISRDLNSTLSTQENNFFVFNIEEQKGIQCRFGERGVTAATHYDSGQNMIAMLTGAKRYILSPPRACPELGVFSDRKSPIFRHSLLNFDHLAYVDDTSRTDWLGQHMSEAERQWLHRAGQAPAIETVLKAGEVLFLPSFWFHYIVSIQKSAQCNARSGIDRRGVKEFGNVKDIDQCAGPQDDDGEDENDGDKERGHRRGRERMPGF